LSGTFRTQNGLKQGDALSPLLFTLSFGVYNKEVPRTPGGTELADSVNLLDDNLHTIKKTTEVRLVGSKEFVLQVNAEETK
jgi:hypothetical protein